MIFGFLKLFRGFLMQMAMPIDQGSTYEMRSVGHAVSPQPSKRVRRPEQDDYG